MNKNEQYMAEKIRAQYTDKIDRFFETYRDF